MSCLAVNETPSHSDEVSLATLDNTVFFFWHPTKMTHPPKPQLEGGTRFTYTPEGQKGE